jgi:curli production assembly/transport component CsgG
MLIVQNCARAFVLAASSVLSGCAAFEAGPFERGPHELPAQVLPDTMTSSAVRDLPAPSRALTVAVYEFPDLTGQHKPNAEFAEYSRAVTQGADAILVDVLTEAGHGSWFNVVERRGLSNLLRERQIIQATREEFQGEAAQPLNPLTFAGVVIEGGIVAYESNVRTGGIGARYLGIGANTQYQEDYVTVALRLVSINSGNVIVSVTTTKQIYSTLVQGNVFRYVSSDSLLDFDAGYTRNSPPQFALREAIELAVFSMIMQGREQGQWDFRDPSEAAAAIALYSERQNTLNSDGMEDAVQAARDLRNPHHQISAWNSWGG